MLYNNKFYKRKKLYHIVFATCESFNGNKYYYFNNALAKNKMSTRRKTTRFRTHVDLNNSPI